VEKIIVQNQLTGKGMLKKDAAQKDVKRKQDI
jgi:hypothetical protein